MSKRHEQLLFRYSSALERGDFSAVADVLREAERDPLLEQLLLDINTVYAAEVPDRFNHTNPKEVPMIASLYQRPAPRSLPWLSLPLIAALALVTVLTVLLASQIRTNTIGTPEHGGQPPAFAQAQPLCTAVVMTPVDVHSRALSSSPVIGALATGATVAVFDQESISLGGDPEGWYFVAAAEVAGWVPALALDAAACGAQPVVLTGTPTPVPALIATGTPIPAQPTCSASLGAQLLPFMLSSRPGYDAAVIFEASSVDPQSVSLLDSSVVAGETWYYVRVDLAPSAQQGWLPAARYDASVTCGLINRGEQPTLVPPGIQPATALPPTIVPPANGQPTVAPPELVPTLIPTSTPLPSR